MFSCKFLIELRSGPALARSTVYKNLTKSHPPLNCFSTLQVPVPPANAQPSHHLVLTMVITMICAFFNLSSLILGIPALLCSSMVSASVLWLYYILCNARSRRIRNTDYWCNFWIIICLLVITGMFVSMFMVNPLIYRHNYNLSGYCN